MNILICDDHALLAETLATRLRGRGHDVRVEHSPEAAVQAVSTAAPDVCLMDLRFPGRPRGGLDAIRAVRHVAPHTALLLLSGALTKETAAAAIAAGAHGVANKAIALTALEAAIEQIARGRAVVSEELAGGSGRMSLTAREREVLDLVAAGSSTVQIAAALDIATSTVRGHVESILSKLGVHSRLDAATLAGRSATSVERRLARTEMAAG